MSTAPTSAPLSELEFNQFQQQGFVIVRQLADDTIRQQILAAGQQQLHDAIEPIEFEADTRYQGAPASRDAEGGKTARRLLQVYARDSAFAQWARDDRVVSRVKQLLGDDHIALTQAHHNSLMTKQPAFSSVTHWHRDIRYWRFQRPDLVSVWLALGHEFRENGCLGFLPGTHHLEIAPERYENMAFLNPQLPENQSLIASAVFPELQAGDVVFFHAMTFHAAGWNRTDATKYSLAFSYHAQDNRPLAGSRSASLPSVLL